MTFAVDWYLIVYSVFRYLAYRHYQQKQYIANTLTQCDVAATDQIIMCGITDVRPREIVVVIWICV